MNEEEAQAIGRAILRLAGSVTAATDQAQSMTDAELGDVLLSGQWSTIEVHEAGRRLAAHQQNHPSPTASAEETR